MELSKELGDRKINVNAIAPGPVETGLFLDDKTDEQIAQVTKLAPIAIGSRVRSCAPTAV
ncbi:MAG: hypothetical protein AVDCRST_MAG09-1823 [uncultured Sphingomonas sp.]|uniref:3-oxoacyl-[acyl-carrier-protein] reductase n=1 Tax=uncultured Sphingomonas sp. TaxID=158754 RepID=A0A6J4TA67_9SPHN|nr:MAG: hypothetical protein AVDCRST_MAG09-1823 [uncultured Sphingomonas sp.]